MVKKILPEMEQRLFRNVYVCMNCNAKIRSTQKKIKAGKVTCRKCGSKALRLKHKERKI